MKDMAATELDGIGRLKLVLVGANVAFLATTIAQFPNNPVTYFPGSFGVYLVLSIANLYPIGLIILHSAYRPVPPRARADLIFSLLALEWISTVGFVIEAAKSGAFVGGLVSTMLPVTVAGVLLIVSWKLVIGRIDQSQHRPESMFP